VSPPQGEALPPHRQRVCFGQQAFEGPEDDASDPARPPPIACPP